MSDVKHRGEIPDGFSFWTRQLFGMTINGIDSPSLNVWSLNTAFDAPITITNSSGETSFGLTAKDLFLNFITHPNVHDTAMELIKQKVGNIAATQISNFIIREMRTPRSSRPVKIPTPMDILKSIANRSTLDS